VVVAVVVYLALVFAVVLILIGQGSPHDPTGSAPTRIESPAPE
jgi:hypothetical protein